jgi:histidinol dehydrogenase
MIKIVKSTDIDFREKLEATLHRGETQGEKVEIIVKSIIADVKTKGDSALLESISKFDGWSPKNGSDLMVSTDAMKKAYENLDEKLKDALHTAYKRIEAYHKELKPKSWMMTELNGTILGQKVTPVDRAGLYIPGGKAVYPSSLLMNAIPAIVAGVEEIVVCTPTPGGEPNELLMAAAHLCGIKKMFKVGGASAVAAMAYGSGTIPKVDVITGPGNIFVATAKKLVFGDVNIDMIAGPSEIGILADESANPSWLALDMLSQAEHDELAGSYLVTTSERVANETAKEIERYLKELPRAEISSVSIANNGIIIVCESVKEAIDIMNNIAPEHLEVCVANALELLPFIKHAGAIFLGHYTPEAIGDYLAGPNHTLPTGASARFFSPLSTEHFMKKSSIISFSKQAIGELGDKCATIADVEGLFAHKESVLARLKGE